MISLFPIPPRIYIAASSHPCDSTSTSKKKRRKILDTHTANETSWHSFYPWSFCPTWFWLGIAHYATDSSSSSARHHSIGRDKSGTQTYRRILQMIMIINPCVHKMHLRWQSLFSKECPGYARARAKQEESPSLFLVHTMNRKMSSFVRCTVHHNGRLVEANHIANEADSEVFVKVKKKNIWLGHLSEALVPCHDPSRMYFFFYRRCLSRVIEHGFGEREKER